MAHWLGECAFEFALFQVSPVCARSGIAGARVLASESPRSTRGNGQFIVAACRECRTQVNSICIRDRNSTVALYVKDNGV